jgi:hypothetical protein
MIKCRELYTGFHFDQTNVWIEKVRVTTATKLNSKKTPFMINTIDYLSSILR